jgi:hypothetical protein
LLARSVAISAISAISAIFALRFLRFSRFAYFRVILNFARGRGYLLGAGIFGIIQLLKTQIYSAI